MIQSHPLYRRTLKSISQACQRVLNIKSNISHQNISERVKSDFRKLYFEFQGHILLQYPIKNQGHKSQQQQYKVFTKFWQIKSYMLYINISQYFFLELIFQRKVFDCRLKIFQRKQVMPIKAKRSKNNKTQTIDEIFSLKKSILIIILTKISFIEILFYNELLIIKRKQKMQKAIYKDIVNQIYQEFDIKQSGRLTAIEILNYYNTFNKVNAFPFVFTQELVEKSLAKENLDHANGITRQEYESFLLRSLKGKVFKHIFYPYLSDRSDDNDLRANIYKIYQLFDTDQNKRMDNVELTKFYNEIYKNAGIPIEILPNITKEFLKSIGKQSIDAGDLFNHIRQFKTNPHFINVQ